MSRIFVIWVGFGKSTRYLCDDVDRLASTCRVPILCRLLLKDMILEAAYAANSGVGGMAFWLGCLAAFLTAFYSWRLLIMAFHRAPRASAEVMAHVHESPRVMTLPLLVLAIGAVFAGWLGYEMFVGKGMTQFWGHQSSSCQPIRQ